MRMMLFLMMLFLTACATQQTTHYTKLESVSWSPSLKSLPKAKAVDVDGEQMAAFDLQGMNELQAFADDAKVNAVKAQQVVYLHNLTVQRYNDTMEFYEREEERRKAEDRQNWFEKIFWQVFAIVALL